MGLGLPTFPTSFVARQAEIFQVCELTRGSPAGDRHRNRRVGKNSTDPPGSSRPHETAYPDGVVWVDLSRVTDDGRGSRSEVATACGLAESPGGLDPASMVEQHLTSNDRLVVLDNCEHVLNGASALGRWCPDTPGPFRVAGHQPRAPRRGRGDGVADPLVGRSPAVGVHRGGDQGERNHAFWPAPRRPTSGLCLGRGRVGKRCCDLRTPRRHSTRHRVGGGGAAHDGARRSGAGLGRPFPHLDGGPAVVGTPTNVARVDRLEP